MSATHLVVEPGGALDAGLVVCAAGVSAGALPGRLGLPQADSGRVQVLPNLSLPGHPEVFAVGDVAALPARDGGTVEQLAPPAIQSGRHAARELLRPEGPLRPFRYRDRGTMATIGRPAAVAGLPARVRLTGTPAWLAWCALHLVTLLGARNRLSVLVNWAWQCLSWRDLSWRGGPTVVARDSAPMRPNRHSRTARGRDPIRPSDRDAHPRANARPGSVTGPFSGRSAPARCSILPEGREGRLGHAL